MIETKSNIFFLYSFATQVMFTLRRIAFAPPQKSYRIEVLFIHKARFLYRSEAEPRLSLKWRVTYRIGVHTSYTEQLFDCPLKSSARGSFAPLINRAEINVIVCELKLYPVNTLFSTRDAPPETTGRVDGHQPQEFGFLELVGNALLGQPYGRWVPRNPSTKTQNNKSTVNPLLTTPGGLFISNMFGGRGYQRGEAYLIQRRWCYQLSIKSQNVKWKSSSTRSWRTYSRGSKTNQSELPTRE